MSKQPEEIFQKIEWAKRLQVLATPNINCPACLEKRMHQTDEWKRFHPAAGTGTRRGI